MPLTGRLIANWSKASTQLQTPVTPSTQNQALAALLFLYRELLEMDLERVPALVVGLLYGSGLRLMEPLRLRVKDLDFERRELTVRDGKG